MDTLLFERRIVGVRKLGWQGDAVHDNLVLLLLISCISFAFHIVRGCVCIDGGLQHRVAFVWRFDVTYLFAHYR